LNDLELKENKGYRMGQRRGLEREDLIVWIDYESVNPCKLRIKGTHSY